MLFKNSDLACSLVADTHSVAMVRQNVSFSFKYYISIFIKPVLPPSKTFLSCVLFLLLCPNFHYPSTATKWKKASFFYITSNFSSDFFLVSFIFMLHVNLHLAIVVFIRKIIFQVLLF